VLRGGFGIFYDRFAYNLELEQLRYGVINPLQYQYQLVNPTFFQPGTPLQSAPGSSNTNLYQVNPNLHAPYTMQTGLTLERQLTKTSNIAVTYLNSRGVHQFYTDNLNPVDPATGVRVQSVTDPGAGNIFQYQSEGIFKQNQLIVNGSIRMGTKLTLFGYYVLNYSDSDTSGTGSFPSIPGDPQEDYGRSSYDIRDRLFTGGIIGLPRGFRLSPFMIAQSGIPFNITGGIDPYQSNAYNARPEFASCTSANQTKFGCFLIPATTDFALGTEGSSSGYTPIPVNYGEGPGRFSLNLRLSKTFGFGPVLEGAASGPGGGPGAGTFGRPGGGGGGPRGGRGGGPDAGATNRRYALTFAVSARNIFNDVNLATPIGNLGSPLFGESNALAGRPYSESSSNRRLDLQVTFTF